MSKRNIVFIFSRSFPEKMADKTHADLRKAENYTRNKEILCYEGKKSNF